MGRRENRCAGFPLMSFSGFYCRGGVQDTPNPIRRRPYPRESSTQSSNSPGWYDATCHHGEGTSCCVPSIEPWLHGWTPGSTIRGVLFQEERHCKHITSNCFVAIFPTSRAGAFIALRLWRAPGRVWGCASSRWRGASSEVDQETLDLGWTGILWQRQQV